MNSELAIILPALNEANTIASVVRGAQAHGQAIVVDDGSIDGTGDIARQAGALVLTHVHNRGYERALESGVLEARRLGFAYAITLDADGQHDPTLVARFVTALRGGVDLVAGRRDRFQRFSERVFAWVGRIAWGIDDPLCGLKGYRLSCLDEAGPFYSYPSVATELSIRMIRRGCSVQQIDIVTLPREGASRFGRGLRVNLRVFKALANVIFRR